MTRRHFKALAQAFAGTRPNAADPANAVWRESLLAVADVCAEANPRFDRSRFIEACWAM